MSRKTTLKNLRNVKYGNVNYKRALSGAQGGTEFIENWLKNNCAGPYRYSGGSYIMFHLKSDALLALISLS